MEPFGLFNLLKTLLPNANETPEPPRQNQAQTPQNPTPPPTETQAYPQQNNPWWEFMVKHDERARNTKKKG